MGVHHLITGLNGAGKTLYCVADKLRPLVGSTVEYRGEQIPRRLVVGGIRDLLIDHVVLDVPQLELDSFVDTWGSEVRDAGSPGREDVVVSILNWWLWAMPGDVIVVDECQRVFRPMAQGRKVPRFIAMLETARHYGVEFIYLTQHPMLLHMNVRKLVGPHEDIRRVFGGNRTVVYQWDRVANPDHVAKAVSRIWKHDAAAFKLYKSAEIHGSFSTRWPLAVWLGGAALVGLVAVGFVVKARLSERFEPPVAAALPAASVAPKSPVGSADARSAARWPVYQSSPVAPVEPLDGRAVVLEGGYSSGGRVFALFGLYVDGKRAASASTAQLNAMGYTFVDLGVCSGLLTYRTVQRVLSCAPPIDLPVSRPSPADAPKALTL